MLDLSKASPQSETPSEFIRSQGPRKRNSTEDYLKSIHSKRPMPAGSFQPALSDIGNSLSRSDLESQQSNDIYLSKSSTLLQDTTTQNGRVETISASISDELRNIRIELSNLFSKQEDVRKRLMKGVLKVSSVHSRNEVLKEASKALSDRAATKFTMGRAERLILEREADVIYRMALTRTGSAAGHQHVGSLRVEREEIWQAIRDKVDLLFEKSLDLAQKAHSG